MTPEERADKVSEELDCSFRGEWSGHIAAAIRAAENDALERAASWHDEQSALFKRRAVETLSLICPSEDVACAQDQMSDFYRDCAKAVRALKHKDIK